MALISSHSIPAMMVATTAVTSFLAAFLVLIAMYGRKQLAGTTLTAPCVWVALSAACLAIFAVIERQQATETLAMSALQLAVAVSTLCPLVAVLGAKRPQDRGWQWVVVTLWLIAVWPAAQALAHPAGPRVELLMPWKLFLVSLVAMGPLNYLPTRHWMAALLVAAGQLMILSQFLGVGIDHEWQLAMGIACFVVAAVIVVTRKQPQAIEPHGLAEEARRWFRFRDSFGAFWALRVMQRVNETAVLRKWPVRLGWSGFEAVGDEQAASVGEAQILEIQQTYDTLLRRFF